MVVRFDVTNPRGKGYVIAKHEVTPGRPDWKAVLTSDEDGFPRKTALGKRAFD